MYYHKTLDLISTTSLNTIELIFITMNRNTTQNPILINTSTYWKTAICRIAYHRSKSDHKVDTCRNEVHYLRHSEIKTILMHTLLNYNDINKYLKNCHSTEMYIKEVIKPFKSCDCCDSRFTNIFLIPAYMTYFSLYVLCMKSYLL